VNALLRSTWAVLAKDIRTEFRTRYALSAILMFALASIGLVSFALKGEVLTARQMAAMTWIVIFFSAAAGLSRPFVQEAEAGTELLLRQAAGPEAVWLGKFLFSLAMTAVIEAVVFPVFTGMMDARVARPLELAGIAALGAVALAGASTIIAAMVASAQSKASVFAVAALPVLLPALLMLVDASAPAFGAVAAQDASRAAVLGVVSYTGILIVLSWLLFPAVWEE